MRALVPRGRLGEAGNGERRRDDAVLPTFLYSLRQVLLQGGPTGSAYYAHNGAVYRLTTEAHRDSLTGDLVVTARTCRRDASGASEFKLWLAPGSATDLPRRIEFRAKSYLKLTLEVDETQHRPVFQRLFEEAQS